MSVQDPRLESFAGQARLFPLPGLVLFPQAVQPLHIFEPRYRQMTADALAGDRRIALALPRPGWEADYAGKPALFPIACLGTILAEQVLEDGRFNLLLRGLSRIRIVEEVPHDRLYRLANVELLADVPLEDLAREAGYRERLAQVALSRFADAPAQMRQEFAKILNSQVALGTLADVVAFTLPLAIELKRALLEELDIERRLRLLIDHLGKGTPGASGASVPRAFPPEFSAN